MDFELRKWKIEDIESLAKHANNKKVASNLRDGFPYPYTKDDAREFIESCQSCDDSKNMFRAIVVDNEAVGSIGIFLGSDVYKKSAEIGYWLAEDYWGRGIMSNAIKEMCNQAFSTFDIMRIYAEPFAYNQGSRRVLEKAGFVLEGIMKSGVYKYGQIHDYCMYALVR